MHKNKHSCLWVVGLSPNFPYLMNFLNYHFFKKEGKSLRKTRKRRTNKLSINKEAKGIE